MQKMLILILGIFVSLNSSADPYRPGARILVLSNHGALVTHAHPGYALSLQTEGVTEVLKGWGPYELYFEAPQNEQSPRALEKWVWTRVNLAQFSPVSAYVRVVSRQTFLQLMTLSGGQIPYDKTRMLLFLSQLEGDPESSCESLLGHHLGAFIVIEKLQE